METSSSSSTTSKKRGTSPSSSIRNKIDKITIAAMFGNKNNNNEKTQSQQSSSNINITKQEIENSINNINTILQSTLLKKNNNATLTIQNTKNTLEMLKDSIGILLRASKQKELHGYDNKALKLYASDALTHAEYLKDRIDNQNNNNNNRISSSSSLRNHNTRSQSGRFKSTSTAPVVRGTNRSRSNPDLSKKENNELMTSILNEMFIPPGSAKTTWNDIAGLNDCKRALQESVILPILRPDLYTGLRSPAKGILLYGPPGTGKTMLAKAAASESNSNFFSCSASSLTSKWHGESEKLLKTLFDLCYIYSPSIIFFDEIDALLSTRKSDEHEASRRFKTEFMIRVDGVNSNSSSNNHDSSKNVLVLGCTNCPWDLDQAVLRRFQRRIYVPLPDDTTRRILLEKMLNSINKHSLKTKDITKLVTLTDGYSCSDIQCIGREASFGPLRGINLENLKKVNEKDVRPIQFIDFEDAVRNNSKTVSANLLQKYMEWENDQGSG